MWSSCPFATPPTLPPQPKAVKCIIPREDIVSISCVLNICLYQWDFLQELYLGKYYGRHETEQQNMTQEKEIILFLMGITALVSSHGASWRKFGRCGASSCRRRNTKGVRQGDKVAGTYCTSTSLTFPEHIVMNTFSVTHAPISRFNKCCCERTPERYSN